MPDPRFLDAGTFARPAFVVYPPWLCGALANGVRSKAIAAMNAKARKRLRHRKYDLASHRRIRKEFSPLVAAGLVNCVRCGDLIEPGTPWDLGMPTTDWATTAPSMRTATAPPRIAV